MSATTRTREILEDLEAVRENLLALSDEIWQSINHNDPAALEAGVEFKRAYNAKAAAFDNVASELSALVQQFTSVRLEAAEQSGGGDDAENERIIAELNREEPHHLGEDFTYKRPHGFIFDQHAFTGITTWQRLFLLVLQQIDALDPHYIAGLVDDSEFISNRGNPSFSRNPKDLRSAMDLGNGVFAECNLSANGLRDVIRKVMKHLRISLDRLKIFLRQDRDAGRLADAA